MKISKKGFYFLGIIYFLNFALLAQNYRFKHLGLEKGLSNGQVNCIFQDSKGFMWFGTNDGLNCYDGYYFKVYRKKIGIATKFELPSDDIISINEDKNGNLWVGTTAGLAKYNRDIDQFEFINQLGDKPIASIFLDNQGNVWVGGEKQLAIWHDKIQQWEFLYDSFKQSDFIGAIAQTSRDDFWLGSNGQGLYHLHLPSKKINQYLNEPNNPNSLTDNNIYRIYYDQKNNLWIGTTYGGLSQFDLKNRRFTNYKAGFNTILFNSIKEICVDGQFILFAVENGGISSFDTRNKTFKNFLHHPSDPYSLSENSVRSIYIDQQGRVWAGTYSKGINVWDKNAEKFNKLSIDFPNQTINAILKDSKDRLWIGTENGVIKIVNNKTYLYQHHPNNPASLSADPVLKIYEDQKKRIWLGTWLGGLNLYDEKNDNFKRYKYDSATANAPNLNSLFAISEGSQQQLWVGGFGGLSYFNEINQNLTFYASPLKIDFIREIIKDKEENLWLATQNGLHFINQKNQSYRLFKHIPQEKHSLSSTAIYCILEDHKNRIWIGTKEGLNLMTSFGKFISFTTLDGLPSNQINDIIEDKKGNLWLTTGQGLCKFNPEKKICIKYSEADGLNSKQFQNNSFFQDTDGKVYVGSINGVNVFHPDSIEINPSKPIVHIIDFKLFNKSVAIDPQGVLKKVINQTKEITLSYKHSVFSFEFVAINFTQSEKNQYAYIMEGFEKEWNYVGNQRIATYTNLNSGTYTFRVKASNNDGVWNEEGTFIRIIILPPWWETWWFRLLALSLILGSGYAFLKMRTDFLKKQNQKLENVVLERTQEINQQKEEIETQSAYLQEMNFLKDKLFSVIAHDLRSPLNSLKGTMNLLRSGDLSIEDFNLLIQKLNTNLSVTSGLLDNLLFWARSQMQGYQIRAEKIDIQELVNNQCVLFEKMARDKQIALQNKIQQPIIVFADKNMIDLILRNLVANAIKFCQKDDKIEIYAQNLEKDALITVQDSGVGIEPENLEKLFTLNNFTTLGTKNEKGTGLGLMLCKEFVEKNDGKIWVESELGKGAKFVFSLPLA
jgi:ligand-binding sensor domain-containing protein/signal transduction histidine kinase